MLFLTLVFPDAKLFLLLIQRQSEATVATLSMGTITGTATQASTAVQGVMVRAEDSTLTSGNMAISGSDGTYSIKVPAGTYSLVCYFPGVGEGTPVTGITVTANTTTSGKNCTQ